MPGDQEKWSVTRMEGNPTTHSKDVIHLLKVVKEKEVQKHQGAKSQVQCSMVGKEYESTMHTKL